MEFVKVNTSQHIDIDYPVAGLGERLGAYFIDLALFIAIFLVYLLIMAWTGLIAQSEVFNLVMTVIYLVGYGFYDLLCEVFMNGQSIGKRLLKIKVISLDGAQPSIGQYFIRWIFRLVDIGLTSGIAALVSVAITDNKQRIGDLVAGTTVIKTSPYTKLQNVAFHPVNEDYVPTFESANLLSDRDIELIHEVLMTYYKTYNIQLIYQMANKVLQHIQAVVPQGMNELDFLNTVITDYNHITSKGV